MILNRKSILAVFAFILLFVNRPAFATAYSLGKEAGIKQCQDNPQSCDIKPYDPNAITEAGINAGKKQCQDNPEDCGLVRPNSRGTYDDGVNAGKTQGIAEGKKQCQDKPEDCGLIAKDSRGTYDDGVNAGKKLGKAQGISEGKTEGQKQCKDKPEDCGLLKVDKDGKFNQASIKEGETECRNDPIACGIFTENNTKEIVNYVNTSCNTQNQFCGITIVTPEGIDKGKEECKDNLASCFQVVKSVKPSGNELPDEFCDYKTKNCFSTTEAVYLNAVYLATEDAEGNPITTDPLPILIKDLQMEVILTDDKLLLLNDNVKELSFLGQDEQKTLKITVTGTENVISYPSGINCDTDCKEIYKIGSPVELFAVPTSSTKFEEWTGDCTGKENHISITMNKDTTCTAVFK